MPITPDLPKTEAAIVEMTNAFRRENALSVVKTEGKLAKAARDYARFLAAAPIFSHEADGRRPQDRIKAAGYAPCHTAENLAWMLDSRGFETRDLAYKLVEGWKKSPPHRKNLMLQHVMETGVAVAKVTGAEKYMAVQLFGRPQSMQYTFTIENRAGRMVPYKVGTQKVELKANTLVRHTVCDPVVLELQVGGLNASQKSATTRYAARDGQIYRLTRAKSGEVKVEVGSR
jgi:hypothetical protein